MRRISCLALALAAGATAHAQTITNGFTYAVASAGGACGTGTHFHSSTGGVYGNPAGKAEVGNYSSECVRGLSEYNLTGLTSSPAAYVTFNVYNAAGLFAGTNSFPFSGIVNIVAYQGNNAEDISDYQAATIGTVGSFNTAGLTAGNILSFDISSIFNSAIAAGYSSLGIRLQRAGESSTNSGAYTFDTFRLTSNNQSTVNTTAPEPNTYVLLAAGLAGAGFVTSRRRRARQ